MTADQLNLSNILSVAEATAREAGAVLRRAYYEPRTISYKGVVDLVTEADQASEAVIVNRLKAAFPEHTILAEEGGESLAAIPGKSSLTWLIDPLDGTTNFAHGFPVFAVSMALRDEHDLLLGVVYDPLRDECFTGANGLGASLNGESIRVSEVPVLGQALLATGFPYDRQVAADNNTAAFAMFLRRAQGIRRAGAAALDMAYVACGRIDAYWEMRIQSWDIGAGVVIVREAGGIVTDYEGRADTLGILAARKVIASSGQFHAAMVQTLAEVYGVHSDDDS